MDETEVLTQTLNNTLQRHARVVQGYEVEIANITAELFRLQATIQQLSNSDKSEKIKNS
jgi:hypothetical protein